MVEPSPGIERIIENKGPYVISLSYQFLGKMGTDKSVSAGDENFFILQVHFLSIPYGNKFHKTTHRPSELKGPNTAPPSQSHLRKARSAEGKV
jgi:hypothetical protein